MNGFAGGSATKDDNTQVFDELGIDFSATVPPDSVMEAAILDYLQTHVDGDIGSDEHWEENGFRDAPSLR